MKIYTTFIILLYIFHFELMTALFSFSAVFENKTKHKPGEVKLQSLKKKKIQCSDSSFLKSVIFAAMTLHLIVHYVF